MLNAWRESPPKKELEKMNYFRKITVLTKLILLAKTLLLLCLLFSETEAQTIPSTDVPAGFGRYCSVTYPGGAWGLLNYTDPNSDPCKDLLKSGSNGKIERAGLWSVSKNNNVLRVCDGDLGIYRQVGNGVIKNAFDDAKNKKNCVFTIAPTALPVFSKPYKVLSPLPESVVKLTNPHNFNRFGKAVKISDFGQPTNPDCRNSTNINRTGKQFCNGHNGYDWVMPTGTEMRAMADGIVREARWRDTKAFANGDKTKDCYKKSPQGEFYVEHQIGTGEYAERFIAYYAHVSEIKVKKGDKVTRGQLLGKSGDTGCSSDPHLHFSVMRTTNLSGHRKITLTYPDTGYGVSSLSGEVDPFGWSAPKGIDPWAWQNFGSYQDGYIGTIVNPGAFSINLFREGQAPPH
jgi:murein DD-endopeptidase MepM/ murein hydrolase activator NlpD